jgi:signal transduction histidine kinase/AmiR/NasT family two-component response regulator
MFSIHLPTLFAFTTLLSTALGALLIWLWQRDRSQPALASWGAGRLLTTISVPMLATRGHLPDWASINLPNALICLSYGLTWAGARQFEGLRARPAAVLAGPAVWLLACQIPAFFASLQARVALIASIVAMYSVAAAVEFRRGQARSPLPSRPLVVVLLLVIALICVACGPISAFFPFSQNGAGLPTSLWFGALVGLAMGLMAGTSILLVALTKEQAELRSTTALAAARDVAADASEQKTRFLARMSHELRTPLNGVLGLAQVLANDTELGERQRQQAATLEQAGRHLLAILNEVLDLSRIEAGKLAFLPAPVTLGRFLRDTLALVLGNAESKTIRLTLVAEPDLPDTVLADPMRLRQILFNLLNNALKFTPSNGCVTLAVARGSGDIVTFAITDTGRGVPAALRPRLFQDYAQAEEDNASGGSGLGLAISARLAVAMGGDLSHSDGPDGIGSRFTLTLPLPAVATPEVAVPATMPETQPSTPPRGLRILVVDDVALNRMTARALLRHAGHEVEDAEDGHAALAAIARGPLPDVVLMDQSMPTMDGHSVARHIRAMPGPAGLVPILAVTANALPEDIDASMQAGMDGHVTKPIELKALLAAIAGALDQGAARQRGVRRCVDGTGKRVGS